MFILLLLIVGLLLALLVRDMVSRPSRYGLKLPAQPDGVTRAVWKQVLRSCRGDQEQALRMLDYEKKRRPGIDNKQACRSLLFRYERDNR